MKEEELQESLEKIRKGMHLFDTMIHSEHDRLDFESEPKWYITEKQREIVKSLFDLFQSLNWQIALNSYKQINYEESDPINVNGLLNNGCGTPVKVRSCKKEHGDKTYFGILIGDVPLSVGSSIDGDGNLTIKRRMYNPCIFIPELKDITYGASSWWREIESEEELNKLITEDTIKNVWYVRLLNTTKVKCRPSDEEYLEMILPFFPKAFIKEETREIIIEAKNNVYFRLDNIENYLDFDCKMLEYISRPSCKGVSLYWQRYFSRGLNSYFRKSWTKEEIREIYTYIGGGVNRKKTIQFIKSGFDVKVLHK
jgi:hypothetical protein